MNLQIPGPSMQRGGQLQRDLAERVSLAGTRPGVKGWLSPVQSGFTGLGEAGPEFQSEAASSLPRPGAQGVSVDSTQPRGFLQPSDLLMGTLAPKRQAGACPWELGTGGAAGSWGHRPLSPRCPGTLGSAAEPRSAGGQTGSVCGE